MNRGVPCRYVINKENCPYGERCRFLHQYRADLRKPAATKSPHIQHQTEEHDNGECTSKEEKQQVPQDGEDSLEVQAGHMKSSSGNGTSANVKHQGKQVCRFFVLYSGCKYGDKCRYLHSIREGTATEQKMENLRQEKLQEGYREVQENQKETKKWFQHRGGHDKTRQRKQHRLGREQEGQKEQRKHHGSNENQRKQQNYLRHRSDEQDEKKEQKMHYGSREVHKGQAKGHNQHRGDVVQEDQEKHHGSHGKDQGQLHENCADKVQEGQEGHVRRGYKVHEEHECHQGKYSRGKGNEEYQDPNSRNPPPLTLASFIGRRAPVQRPSKTNRSQKESSGTALREVELEQLQVRYPGDSCTLLTKSQEKVTYRIQFEPSDQEWRGPQSIQLEVTFPASYPEQYCQVQLSADQDLSEDAIISGNQAISDYWKPNMLGSLMLRPFLHWWDKNLVSIMQSCFQDPESEGSSEIEGSESDEDEGTGNEELEEEETRKVVCRTTSKRGTEIRLMGLDTSQTLGTAFWTTIKVVLSCSRCKNHQEIELQEERLYSTICGRCSNAMRVMYHLALIHAASATLGYLELTSCTPVDVVFQSSTLAVTCINCSSEVSSRGFFIGQPKDIYCRRCHDKITINASGVRFLQHQHSDISRMQPECMVVLKSSKKEADILLKDGEPLPEYGICQHYKKSHRWLRFPCCGRAFPCDVCHDSAQDHVMERANRMICGYCSKEQGYSGECARCRSDLTSSRSSAHWEGGQGCRNKVKMNRLDKQKYRDNAKTICKKSERVGRKAQKTTS